MLTACSLKLDALENRMETMNELVARIRQLETSRIFDSAGTFRRAVAPKAIYIILNQLDLAMTLAAVHSGLKEMNPMFRSVLHEPLLLSLMKVLMPVLIAWLAPGKMLLPAIIFVALVCAWDANCLFIHFLI